MTIETDSRVLLFAGTTEGRQLAGELTKRGIHVTACVATDYGQSLLEDLSGVSVLSGRLDEERMEALIRTGGFSLVLDATHPYAREASENISRAGKAADIPVIRVLRKSIAVEKDAVVYVESVEGAVDYINRCCAEGNILATTGSKEIAKYRAIDGYGERVYARVLPLEDSLKACREAEIPASHIICMQGPFTRKMNEAMLEQTKAVCMVTKESGKAGGFEEKLLAARAAGVCLVVIGRPMEEEGMTVEQVLSLCGPWEAKEEACPSPVEGHAGRQLLNLVGIGPGSLQGMTVEAREAINRAQICFGAPRMLNSLPDGCLCDKQEMYLPGDIIAWMEGHREYQEAAVLLSGDVGFYSGAKKLLLAAEKAGIQTRMVCGVSSAVYFLNKLGVSWDHTSFVSLHGRKNDSEALHRIRGSKHTFLLMNGMESLHTLCRQLTDCGLKQVKLYVGENLSYDTEKIQSGTPEELLEKQFGSLLVVLAENDSPRKYIPFGIPDEAFIRDRVPMTKSEVRAVSMSRLRIPSDGIVYDIGAGTGSVSVEMALQAYEGRVYAIEKNPDGIGVMEENRKQFGLYNLEIIEGKAPEALKELPAPTHVFIGGSSGQMRSCISLALEKNPRCRFVINAITLETLHEVLECEKTLPFELEEITQVTAARAKQAGPYHMMMGQNPVYIITGTGKPGGAAC